MPTCSLKWYSPPSDSMNSLSCLTRAGNSSNPNAQGRQVGRQPFKWNNSTVVPPNIFLTKEKHNSLPCIFNILLFIFQVKTVLVLLTSIALRQKFVPGRLLEVHMGEKSLLKKLTFENQPRSLHDINIVFALQSTKSTINLVFRF